MDTFDDLYGALSPDLASRAGRLRSSMNGPTAPDVVGAIGSARYFYEIGDIDCAIVWMSRAEHAAARGEQLRAEVAAIVGPENSEAVDMLIRLIARFIRPSRPHNAAST